MRKRVWLLAMGTMVLALSQWRMPLTYDEAWNYNETASLGPIFTLTRYFFNNHTLYTFLVSLLPPGWVTLDPFLMRLPNVVTAVCLFALIYRIFEADLESDKTSSGRTAILHVVLATSAVFASAQLAFYYLVGRGYLLGSTLALAAIYLRQSKFRAWLSDVTLALSAHTVFTFTYTWPGLLLVDLLEHGTSWKGLTRIGWRWSRSALTLFVLYVPFVRQMAAESRLYRNFTAPFEYTRQLLKVTFDWHALSPFLVAGAIGVGFATYLAGKTFSQSRSEQPTVLLPAYLSSAIASYIAFSEATNSLHITQVPFVRNAMFLSLFGILSLALSAVHWLPRSPVESIGGRLRVAAALAAFVIVFINGLATLTAMAPPLLTGRYLRLPVTNTDCPVPITNRFLASLPRGAEIFCAGYAAAVCGPFRANIVRFGLAYLPGGDDAFEREPRVPDCWSGTDAGGRSCSLYVRPTRRDPFQPLCY